MVQTVDSQTNTPSEIDTYRQKAIKTNLAQSIGLIEERLREGLNYDDFGQKEMVQLGLAFILATNHLSLSGRDRALCNYDDLCKRGTIVARRLVRMYRIQDDAAQFMCRISFRSEYILVASFAALCLNEVQRGGLELTDFDKKDYGLHVYHLTMFVDEARWRLQDISQRPIPADDIRLDKSTLLAQSSMSMH